MPIFNGGRVSKNYLSLKVCDELYDLIAQRADATHKNLIDVAVMAIAAHFGHPEFGHVPREPLGRKRKNGHLNGHQGKRNGKVAKAS